MLFGKHINKYYGKYFIMFFLGIVALIVLDFVQLRIPEIIGELIDYLRSGTLTHDILVEEMIWMIVIAIITFVGRFTWRYCLFGASIRIETDLRREMFAKTEKMSQTYLADNKTGALMALYTNDLETISRTIADGTLMTIDAIFMGVLVLIKMFRFSVVLTLVSASPLIILAIMGGILEKIFKKKSLENHEAFESLSDFVQESFSGIAVIKAFVKEKKELREFRKYNQKNMDTTLSLAKVGVIYDTVLDLIIYFVAGMLVLFASYIIYLISIGESDSTFTVGKLTTFVGYFDNLIWPMFAVGQLISVISQGKASLQRVSELLDEEVEINDDFATIEVSNDIQGNIEFKDFSFTYPNTDLEVLHNITCKINAGEMIGIIGRTGCGKTTLVESLLRFYNIPEGKIFIDGMDVMKMHLKDVRNAISYVAQDNFLYSQTILENIAFSKDDVDECRDEVIEYAKLADIHDDVSSFSNQYDTILGERGITVSGGQRQRITIARALLKNAPILILDDSVSAVDTKTEEMILNNLRQLRKGKTTIIIAHRITTLSTLDRIMVIEDGSLTNFDTSDNLEKINKFYAKQVSLQRLEEEAGGRNE